WPPVRRRGRGGHGPEAPADRATGARVLDAPSAVGVSLSLRRGVDPARGRPPRHRDPSECVWRVVLRCDLRALRAYHEGTKNHEDHENDLHKSDSWPSWALRAFVKKGIASTSSLVTACYV